MPSVRIFISAGFILPLLCSLGLAQQTANPPLPDVRALMREVEEHQKQLDKVRENYTYSALLTTQEIDSNGHVKKTETSEYEEFFVNGHQIERLARKDGKPLDGHDLEKETERVTKQVEKAEKPPANQEKDEKNLVSVRRLLELMEVRNPRRESFRGRPTIVFDFAGRKDAKTHGIAEDASKKLQGTVWIDEGDRQIAHLEFQFDENFHVAGGLVASVQKGTNIHIDQGLVNGELWLPTGAEGNVEMRVLLVKNVREHITERDYDYKRFRVETQQSKDGKPVPEKKP